MGGMKMQGGPTAFQRIIMERKDRLMNEASDVVQRVLEKAELIHKQYATRILTGHMRGTIDWEMTSNSGAVVSGRFGWTDFDAGHDMYIMFQDYGTIYISALNSLTDAAVEARQLFTEMIADAIRKALS